MKALKALLVFLVWPSALLNLLDRLNPPRPARWAYKAVGGALTFVFWVLLAALCGALGPIVTLAGPPIAKGLGLPLTIERCVILPLGGYVRVEGLEVGNPEAFVAAKPDVYGQTPLARVGLLECDVAMRSLLAREIGVDVLRLSGLRVLYAFDQDTTNVDALMKQMGIQPQPAAAEGEAPAAEEPPPPAAETATPAKEPLRFRIAYAHFEDNSVTIRKFINIPLPLPPMTFRDIDSDSLKAKLDAVVEPIRKTIRGTAEGVGGALDALGTGAKDVGTGAKDAVEDGAKAVGDAIKGLKGIFGK